MEQEKIQVPQSWLDQRNEEAQRRELIGEWRGYLAGEQRKVLEESPYGVFRSRLPIDALKAFSKEEVDELMRHEEAEHSRLKPLAQTRHDQRAAFFRAGGDLADFDLHWETGGREATIAEMASCDLERAERSSSIY